MERWQIQLIETALAVVIYFVARIAFRTVVKRVGGRFNYQITRISLIKRILEFNLIVVLGAFVLLVWGVEQSKLVFFFTSLLTVLGIAFFAQWSIISNITSSIIIFFNHPVKIGDYIQVLDKEFEIKGNVLDIGLFFLIIETEDHERVTIPSNVFMQKMIKRRESNELED